MRSKLSQQEFEARARTEAILQQLVIACRQVGRMAGKLSGLSLVWNVVCLDYLISGLYLFCTISFLDYIFSGLYLIWLVQVGELEKREVKASEEVASLRQEVLSHSALDSWT